MELNEYQELASKTAHYPDIEDGDYMLKDCKPSHPLLMLAAEVGEVCGSVEKIFRHDGGYLEESRKLEIKYELGDVLWCLSEVIKKMGFTLEDVAKSNLEKLGKRHGVDVKA